MKITFNKKPTLKTQLIFCSIEKSSGYPDFEGEKEKCRVYYENNIRQIMVGLGGQKKITPEIIRRASAVSVSKLKEEKIEKASLILPELKSLRAKDIAYALAEGAVLKDYTFDKYKTDNQEKTIKILEFVSNKNIQKAVSQAEIICRCTNYVRDLVNENAHVMTPPKLAQEAKKLSSKYKLPLKVLAEKEIAKEKLGLLKAAGQGSPYPSQLIILQYKGNKKSKKQIAIIGKAITFDSGGINLKTSKSIKEMRSDMAGGACALAVVKACAELKIPVNIIGVASAAYNAIDGTSCIPGDIYKSYSGKTVEIANTDAEGRLVLADAISYIVKNYAPETIIDLGTLTGAISTSLAHFVAGIFSNNNKLIQEIFEAGEKTHERVWQLPLYEEYKESMKGDLADLTNVSKLGSNAGSITCAAFLESFTEKTTWAHIDIAATAFFSKPLGYMPKFGTGFGVRLIVEWLKRTSRKR